MIRFTQQLQPLGGILFLQNSADQIVGLCAAFDVAARFGIKHIDRLAFLSIKPRARLLPERAFVDQGFQHRRRCEVLGKRIDRCRQRVLHRLDHVRHRVEADDVRSAERRALGAAELGPGQVVDDVVGEAIFLRFLDRRQHAKDAHPVGDEVRRVFRAHDALAERRCQKRFQIVKDFRPRRGRRNQFDQMHVTRRIEKMDAAEARLQSLIHRLGKLCDRQARRVGRKDRVVGNERRDFAVQIVFPIHPLGDRFDDHIAAAQQLQIFFVVRWLDVDRIVLVAERRRIQLFQVLYRAQHDSIFTWAFGVGQIEQHHRHFRVHAVRSDLRSHHASAQHCNFSYHEVIHAFLDC